MLMDFRVLFTIFTIYYYYYLEYLFTIEYNKKKIITLLMINVFYLKNFCENFQHIIC